MSATTVPEVELYVRSLAGSVGCQHRALEQLDRLASANELDSFSVDVWGEAIHLSGPALETDRCQSIIDTVHSFRTWADQQGVSLDSFYQRTLESSQFTARSHETLRLPVVALAEYEDGNLVRVTPHERNGTVQTVEQHLELLTTNATDHPRRERVEM